MIDIFFEKVSILLPAAMERMVGYSDAELNQIEKLYDISIRGDFRKFMSRAGRSDGGVIGDDPLIYYRPTWTVRGQILFQVNFFSSLQEIGAWDYLNKPFVFSWENESQYYFLQTSLPESDSVFMFDENQLTVVSTGMSFCDYLVETLDRYPIGRPICQGELLTVC